MTSSKKLIEVALPLVKISEACKKDKNRKTGTIRNLHKWFAPMPAPAWRAILFAAAVDAPETAEGRHELLMDIERLVSSESQPPLKQVTDTARRVIRDSVGDRLPTVVDPFCGGGSTLVEAQRLGLSGFGSDLNPLAVLITRALTVIPRRVGNHPPVSPDAFTGSMNTGTGIDGFLSDVHAYGRRIYERAQQTLSGHYALAEDGNTPVAWIWARTVRCPNPACEIRMPLVTSFWLGKRRDAEAWLRPRLGGDHVAFDVIQGKGIPTPVPKIGRGAKFRCLACGETAPESHLRAEGMAGRMGLQLLAVVVDKEGGRGYLPATDEQERSGLQVPKPHDVPSEALPIEPRSIWCTKYGLTRHEDLYTPRQLLAMTTFTSLVSEVRGWIVKDGGDAQYAADVVTVLALVLGRLAQGNSTLVRWRIDSRNGAGQPEKAFGRHDIPVLWDFAEANPIGGSIGDWLQSLETTTRAFSVVDTSGPPAIVLQRDARAVAKEIPDRALIATDPPYFDNIGYADLSDYFYVWLRRALREVDPDLTSTLLAPKSEELIALPSRHGGSKEAAKRYFVDGFTDSFRRLAARADSEFPIIVVYAFRQQEGDGDAVASTGWEAMLDALLSSGLSVVGTWPIHGTGSTRQIGLGQNALASYVVLVCRPRSVEAPMATRKEFLSALRTELPEALARLQEASVAPVDLAQAAIGPGMAVYSRYSRVVEADGSEMRVRDALAIINQVLDETLSEQEAEFDAATRWALTWFETFGTREGDYGVAEMLSKAKNTAIDSLAHDGFVISKASKVRLLGWRELPIGWDPATDKRLTIWEVTHYLIRAHQDEETGSEQAAADLLKKVGNAMGETARDLAYRLFSISERKDWPKEALAYNALVVAWPEIARLAASGDGDAQTSLGV